MLQTTEEINRYQKAKRQLFDLYYEDLNEQQREAVYRVNGPLLVLAGAGSGKTTVLVRRIAHIIRFGDAVLTENVPAFVTALTLSQMEKAAKERDKAFAEDFLPMLAEDPCPPYAILSITFTNKAAGEMKQRLAAILGEETGATVWAGTFHSICLRLLRKFAERAGLPPHFTIFDADDSKRAVAECVKNLGLDEKSYPSRAVAGMISRAKDRMILPEQWENAVQDNAFGGDPFGKSCHAENMGEIYREYANLLSQMGAVDFDDIIMKTVLLLQSDEEVRTYCERRFRYVCIDEYQDTNHAQFLLASLLSGGRRNLMVVGDDDQSIYRFRGATIENILSFDKTYPDAAVVKLEQNYRSTGTILDAANAVIANNQGRHPKALWSAGARGEKIVLRQLETQTDEAKYIVNKISAAVTAGERTYRDFAVLYRMNAQSGSLEKVFARSGIPYRILGGLRFFERKEIKDILAYLCVVCNPQDELRLRRIVNEPKRKIGQTTLQAVESIARQEGITMFQVMQNASAYPALKPSAGKLEEFCDLIAELAKVCEEEGLPALVQAAMDRTGYLDMLRRGGFTELDRIENLQELLSNAVEYASSGENATLSGFLEDVALVSDVDNYDASADAVVMMTVHSAKGLEFPTVFLPGMEDGIFPGMQASMDPSELEEERRLLYVAITRARERLYITHARQRLLFGRTQYNPLSKFVREIPEALMKIEGERRVREEKGDSPFPGYSGRARRQAKPTPYGGIVLPGRSGGAEKTPSSSSFAIGDRVNHPKFGGGDILSVTPMGGDVMYEIAFDTVGTKKLMGSFAKLKK